MKNYPFEYNDNLIPAHFSKAELIKFDELQGGLYTIPIQTSDGNITEMREYSRLLDIFADPEVRDAFEEAFQALKKKPKNANTFINLSDERESGVFMPTTSDEEPEVEALADAGEEPDDEIALIPEGLADYFDELNGKGEINRNTGLRQYSWLSKALKKVARWALPIGGALLGGPLAGAIGGGLGAAVGGHNILQGATLGGLGGLAVGSLGGPSGIANMLGMGGAGAGAAGAAAGGTGAVGGFGQMLGFGGAGAGAGAAGMYGAPTAAQAMAASPWGIGAGAAGAGAASAGGLGGMLGGILSSPLLPLAGIAGLLYKGHTDSGARQEKADRDTAARINTSRTVAGFNHPLRRVDPYDPVYAPNYSNETGHNYFLNKPGAYTGYKKGSHVRGNQGVASISELYLSSHPHLIDGPGNGQDDRIPATIPAGSYIMTAHDTSALGDGSSDAGAMEFEKFMNNIKKKVGHKANRIESHVNRTIYQEEPVKAALSKDELYIPPTMVSIIGDGDNKKGATILDKWRKNLRKHKASGGLSLPPAAKNPWAYMPKDFNFGGKL